MFSKSAIKFWRSMCSKIDNISPLCETKCLVLMQKVSHKHGFVIISLVCVKQIRLFCSKMFHIYCLNCVEKTDYFDINYVEKMDYFMYFNIEKMDS